MWSFLVVFEHPPISGLPHMLERAESILVEQFFSICSIESLNVGVLIGLTRLDVLDRHAGVFGPAHKHLAEKLRSVICSEYLRQSMLVAQQRKYSDQPERRDRSRCEAPPG